MDSPPIRCEDCGKEGFSTTQALAGHRQKHELERLRASDAQPPSKEPLSGEEVDSPGPAADGRLGQMLVEGPEGAEGLGSISGPRERGGAIVLASPRALAELEELHQAMEAAHFREERMVRENSTLRAKVAVFVKREAERTERKRRRAEIRARAPRRRCFYACINEDCQKEWGQDFGEGEPEYADPARYGWKCTCGSGVAWIALAEDFPDATGLAQEARRRIFEFEDGDYAHRFEQLDGLHANEEIDENGFEVVTGLMEAAAQAHDGGSQCRSDALDRRVRRELFRSLLRTSPAES